MNNNVNIITNTNTKIHKIENKLNNLEEEIIKLLKFKYHDEYYNPYNLKTKLSKIDNSKLYSYFKNEINLNEINSNKIIEKYILIEQDLCLYDIDIISIIFKYIKNVNKLLELQHDIINIDNLQKNNNNNISYYDYILSFFYNNNKLIDDKIIYRDTINYFNNKYLNITIRKDIKEKFIVIANNILII
jgi:hypothetical protein